MKKRKFLCGLLLIYICFIVTESVYAKEEAHGVSIDSPIDTKIEMEGLTAIVTLKNISENSLYLDKSIFSITNLEIQNFSLTPIKKEGSDQLTFYNQPDISNIKHEYVILLPDQEIQTFTNLEQYFNFNQMKYELLSVSFFVLTSLLDENFEEVLEKDSYNDMTNVKYITNYTKVKLNYDRDILPYLTNNYKYKKKDRNLFEKIIVTILEKYYGFTKKN